MSAFIFPIQMELVSTISASYAASLRYHFPAFKSSVQLGSSVIGRSVRAIDRDMTFISGGILRKLFVLPHFQRILHCHNARELRRHLVARCCEVPTGCKIGSSDWSSTKVQDWKKAAHDFEHLHLGIVLRSDLLSLARYLSCEHNAQPP